MSADSPFGVPDRNKFSPPMSPTELQDPIAKQVAAAHGRTPAQVMLAWQLAQGVSVCV